MQYIQLEIAFLPVARQNSTLVCLAKAFPTEWIYKHVHNKNRYSYAHICAYMYVYLSLQITTCTVYTAPYLNGQLPGWR
jgi:uncharacterized membrane protein